MVIIPCHRNLCELGYNGAVWGRIGEAVVEVNDSLLLVDIITSIDIILISCITLPYCNVTFDIQMMESVVIRWLARSNEEEVELLEAARCFYE